MSDTQQRLMAATVRVLRDQGITGLSARAIATEAGVNQALVFYHFGTVDGLVERACRGLVQERVAVYREQIAAVTSAAELLQVGRRLHEQEREAGTVAVMAQTLAGGQTNPTLATVGKFALDTWSGEIEKALRRLLDGTPVEELSDIPSLARAVSASFVGLELYDGVDPEAARSALDALDRLGVLLDVLTDLGPVARKALRARLRKTVKT
ncbi:MAG TPA: TetR/AcrR family transcriptional regulator [Jatrophihabitans sp.]|jgi:AcrR family transcriptional regulator